MNISNLLKKIRLILLTSRPISWPNTAFPFAAGYLIANANLDIMFWLGLIFFLMPYNLLMYGVNDIFDYESDLKNPRKNSMQGALVGKDKRPTIWYAILLTVIPLGIAILLLSGSWIAKGFFILLIIFCISYSMPPLRFKEIPILDSLNSSLHFVSPLLFGLLFAGNISLAPYLAALGAFLLWGMASHALGAIQDIKPDRAANIASIATVFGARRTNRIVLAMYSLAAAMVAVAYAPTGIWAAALLSLYILNASFFLKFTSDARSNRFQAAWKNFIWLNYFVGAGLTILLMWGYNTLGLRSNWLLVTTIILLMISLFGLVISLCNLWLMRSKLKSDKSIQHWPQISILMTCYNQSSTINSTLLAALGQNYPDFEILIADLGSTDATLSRLQTQQDKRLRIVELPPSPDGWHKQTWAFETMRQQANGQIVVMLHQDIILYPNALTVLATQMHTKSVGFVAMQTADPTSSLAHLLSVGQFNALINNWSPNFLANLQSQKHSLWYGQLTACDAKQLEKLHGLSKCKDSSIIAADLLRHAMTRGIKTLSLLGTSQAAAQFHQENNPSMDILAEQAYPWSYFSLPMIVAICTTIFITGILPLVLFGWQFLGFGSEIAWLLFVVVVIFYAQRLLHGIVLKQHLIAVLLLPLADLCVAWCMLRSMLQWELGSRQKNTSAHHHA